MNLDEAIFYALYGIAGYSPEVDSVIYFFGEYFIFIAVGIFAYVGLRHWMKMGKRVIPFYALAFFATGIAEAISIVTKILTHRERPFVAYDIPHIISDSSFAFPSGHTTLLFALATATFFFDKKLGLFLYASGIVVGLARVSGGVHYPSDILGGIALGALTGFIVYKLCVKYFLRFVQST